MIFIRSPELPKNIFCQKVVLNTTYIGADVHAAKGVLPHFFEAPSWLERLYTSPRATGRKIPMANV